MYKNVLKNRKTSKKEDIKLALIILAAVLVFIAVLVPIIRFVRLSGRYAEYKEYLNDSFLYAQRHDSLSAVKDGDEIYISPGSAERIHKTIIFKVGMGKLRNDEAVPDSDRYTELSFGDGTKLTVYPVTVKTAYREEREGIMFAYTGKDGYTYIYDSDKISYDDLKP